MLVENKDEKTRGGYGEKKMKDIMLVFKRM